MVQNITLKNGVRVVTERIPYLHSVSIGVWVKAGSSTETQKQNGISHFIEHMLFKGTESRNAREIAAVIDNVGGQLNAFTAKECTCYYVQVMQDDLTLGLELLSDMLKNSVFEKESLYKEQSVVCEEISMVEDTPDDLVHDLAAQAYFRNHPLGRSILGSRENVCSFDAESIRQYMNERYTADRIVLSIAGNFDEARVAELAEQFFGTGIAAAGKVKDAVEVQKFCPENNCLCVHKANEQMNMCLSFPGTSLRDHKMRYAASVFNVVFGGSMSSRLFQEIREKNGLTYSVFSYISQYIDHGMFSVYAGMNPKQTERVIDLVFAMLAKARKELLSADELYHAKNQLKGSLLLGLEGSQSIMSRNGKSMLLLGNIEPIDAMQQNIEAVSMEHISQLMEHIFNENVVCSAFVGNQEFFPKNCDKNRLTE